MSIQILGATFGDNLARRDVTQSIKSKASGGTLDVTASEELIPAFDVSTETKLTNSDLAEIEKKAQEQCDGGADSACIQATKAKLMREKHEEKAQTDTSAANIIAGRHLAVTYRDKDGKIRRTVVPDGQKLNLTGVEFTNKQGEPEPVKWDVYQKAFGDGLSIALWTMTFVFSVAASYRVFKLYGNIFIAVFITVLAVLLPLVGAPAFVGIIFIIVMFAFIEMGRQAKQKASQQ